MKSFVSSAIIALLAATACADSSASESAQGAAFLSANGDPSLQCKSLTPITVVTPSNGGGNGTDSGSGSGSASGSGSGNSGNGSYVIDPTDLVPCQSSN